MNRKSLWKLILAFLVMRARKIISLKAKCATIWFEDKINRNDNDIIKLAAAWLLRQMVESSIHMSRDSWNLGRFSDQEFMGRHEWASFHLNRFTSLFSGKIHIFSPFLSIESSTCRVGEKYSLSALKPQWSFEIGSPSNRISSSRSYMTESSLANVSTKNQMMLHSRCIHIETVLSIPLPRNESIL